jgi:hypothetical protein
MTGSGLSWQVVRSASFSRAESFGMPTGLATEIGICSCGIAQVVQAKDIQGVQVQRGAPSIRNGLMQW